MLQQKKIFKARILHLAMFICAAFILSGCLRPGNQPQKDAKRATVQLVEMAQKDSQLSASSIQAHDLQIFPNIYSKVKDLYVHSVDGQALIQAAYNGVRAKSLEKQQPLSLLEFDEEASNALLASLDDYSVYMNPPAYRSFNEQTRGAYAGLGIQISKHERGLMVISPFEGSPADQAGIKPEDVLTHANGTDLGGMVLEEAINLLKGRVGTSVQVRVERDGKELFTKGIQRELIEIDPVRWEVKDEIGYIRIVGFSSGTSRKVRKAIREIKKQVSEDRLVGYIIDLRRNPGGLLDEAVKVSDIFLNKGKIVSIKDRDHEEKMGALYGDAADEKPIVVLIDEGSASASEIVAAAMADHTRAPLLGKRSFGKGSVQTVYPVGRGGVKMTTALYFTPSGKSVNGGIVPQYEVADDPDKEGDEQLIAALKLVVALAGGAEIHWNAGSVRGR